MPLEWPDGQVPKLEPRDEIRMRDTAPIIGRTKSGAQPPMVPWARPGPGGGQPEYIEGHQLPNRGDCPLPNDAPEFDDGHVEEGRRLIGHLMPMVRGHGFLWHCTGPESFYSIMRDGAIRPSSDVAVVWQSSLGRRIGAVCLFDFDSRPEHCAYYSGASVDIANWFGLSRQKAAAVCIAIDRAKIARVHNVPEALALIPPEEHTNFKRMGELECWHVGPLPVTAFTRVYVAKFDTLDHVEVPRDGREVETVRTMVAPWEEELARPYVPGPDEIDIGKAMAQAEARRSGAVPGSEEDLTPEVREAGERVRKFEHD